MKRTYIILLAIAVTISNAMGSPQDMQVTTSSEILPIILPTYQGLPISNTSYTTTRVAIDDPHVLGQINMQRWFVLMHLAKDPKLLDHERSATVVAAANLPGAKWSEYLFCGAHDINCERIVKALKNRPGFVGSKGPHFKSKIESLLLKPGSFNTEEGDRSRKAFVDRYGKLLISQAPALPQDMYVVRRGGLGAYSPGKGGLPIRSAGFLDGAKRSSDPERRLPLVLNYSAVVQNRLPETLKCSPSQCEEILNAIPDRQKILKQTPKHRPADYPVYLLVKVRVSNVQSDQNQLFIAPGYVTAGADPKSEAAIIGDIAVFADPELTRNIYNFKDLSDSGGITVDNSAASASPEVRAATAATEKPAASEVKAPEPVETKAQAPTQDIVGLSQGIPCTPIQFKRGTSSITLNGKAPAEDVQCLKFRTNRGQTVDLSIQSGNGNVAFSISKLVDNRDHYQFISEKKTYEILIHQTLRAIAPESYTLTLSIN
jgi:hypothetical protein